MKFAAIIFDFDGVIFDSEPMHLKACNQVFSTLGFNISEDDYLAHYVGLADEEMIPLILKTRNIPHDKAMIIKLHRDKIEAYKQTISQTRNLHAIPFLFSFIHSLRQKINNYAICSCAMKDEIHATLRKLENGQLLPYFTQIVAMDDVSQGKPHPEGYLLAASRLGISPIEALVIEDTPRGIAAAKNAGMMVAAITTTHDKAALSEADIIVEDYQSLQSWLENFHN